MQEQIDKINTAYNDTKNTLTKTGTFTEAEIEDQLKPLDKKKASLEEVYDSYGILHVRAGKIYSAGDMDE